MCKSVLKWEDELFWDSSLRFIVKQLDLYIEHNKDNKKEKGKESPDTTNYKIIQCEEW